MLFLFLAVVVTTGVYADPRRIPEQGSGNPDPWPPPGTAQRFDAVRDTWLSSVGDERFGNNGGAGRLKVKGQQEYSLVDFDLNSLRGRLVTAARIHLRSASPKDAPLARVGVSSVATAWEEGTGSGYKRQSGSACFHQAKLEIEDWAYPGSNMLDAVFGGGNTLWNFADCTPPDADGWQTCAVDPDVVAARAAGLSHGFCLFDDTGSEWSLRQGRFNYHWFPNRWLYSRDNAGSASRLEVWVGGKDETAPEPVASVAVDTAGLPAGQALLTWTTPVDHGGGRTLGFHITANAGAGFVPVPRYLIPMAGGAGATVRMHLRDLGLGPGQNVILRIAPVDNAGNVGQATEHGFVVSNAPMTVAIPDADPKPSKPQANAIKAGGLTIRIADLLDKIDPTNGKPIPEKAAGVSAAGLFDLAARRIDLQAARNEHVWFQVNFEGNAEQLDLSFVFAESDAIQTKIWQFGYVGSQAFKGQTKLLPDPLLPVKAPLIVPPLPGAGHLPMQNHSVVLEAHVPHGTRPGLHQGHLIIAAKAETIRLEVALKVWDFTLPDKLSFIAEMNAYGSQYPAEEYYRLAHKYRTCLNHMPYGWSGQPSLAPAMKEDAFDWQAWDKRVGPLLDGSAFADLPRKGQPVDVFYLPLNENWPVNLYDHYSPSYWPEDGFDPVYAEKMKQAFAAFGAHIQSKGWKETIFQFYLNNKIYYREQFARSAAPWIFDEPVNTQDFWALRWYGKRWQEAVKPFKGPLNLWFRGDISYSQFARNMLWGVMDVSYIGGIDAQKLRMQHDQRTFSGPSYWAEYGSANKIEDANTQPVLWCLAAWSRGAMGVLPWQTIGSKQCWEQAEQTALFYPHPDGPLPSVRLLSFSCGQQLVEYLTLYQEATGCDHFQLAKWLNETLGWKETIKKTSSTDAGTSVYEHVGPEAIRRLRYRLGEALSALKPAYQRSLVKWQSFHYDPDRLPEIGYVTPGPKVDARRPDCDDFRPPFR